MIFSVNFGYDINIRYCFLNTHIGDMNMLKRLVSMYIIYIVYFLGIGMTSSGIVLMPFNHLRYSVILLIGLTLFTTGSYVNEFIIDKKNASTSKVLKLVISSLFLAIGIGMISGGIAHFNESPVYVSYLIPIGIIISIMSFTIKNEYALKKNEVKVFVIGTVLTCAIIFFGLSSLADYFIESGRYVPGGDIFMNH